MSISFILRSAFLCLSASYLGAAPVHNFDQEGQSTAIWTSTTPGSNTSATWEFSGSFTQTVVSSGHLGIDQAYQLTGGGALATGTSYNSLLGGISLELWIQPASLSGGKQVIFSTGAAYRGLSLTLWDDTLHFAAKGGEDNSADPTGDLSFQLQASDIDDFIQVVAVLDAAGGMSLFVNPLGHADPGVERSSMSAVGSDFNGADAAGLGQSTGALGASSIDAADEWFTGDFGNFLGKIAIVRAYGESLSGSEVAAQFTAVTTGVEPPPVEEPTLPNILLLMADDMNWRDCSPYYGQPGGHALGTMPGDLTPNLETLASQGMRLDRCVNATAMCAPFRMQLYTGIYPSRSGALPNHGEVKVGTKSIVHHLESLGYRVGLMGKRHIGPSASFPFEYLGSGSDTEATGNINAADAFINRDPGQPYCLIITSNNPHGAWDHGDYVADASTLPILDDVLDTQAYRNSYNAYLGEVSAFDTEVGDWMARVEAGANPENTIFIAMTEQGGSIPSGKWTLYEKGLRTGCLIRWPGRIEGGSSSDALIEVVDFLPTLLEAAGAAPPSGLERLDGLSFLPVLEGEVTEHKRYAYGVHTSRGVNNQPDEGYAIRSIRDDRYKLIWNLQPDESWIQGSTGYLFRTWQDVADGTTSATPEEQAKAQLLVDRFINRPEFQFYDLETDPFELDNRYEDPLHQDRISDLREKLEQWMASQRDRGVLTEKSIDINSLPLADEVDPYNAWADTQPFVWQSERAPAANPDGDAETNFLEWVQRSDPLGPERGQAFSLEIVDLKTQGAGYVTSFTYPRPRDHARSGVSYLLEADDDLDWSDARQLPLQEVEVRPLSMENMEEATVEVAEEGGRDRMFYRLQVQHAPDYEAPLLLQAGDTTGVSLGDLQSELNDRNLTFTIQTTLPASPVEDGSGNPEAEVLWKTGGNTGMSLVLLGDQIVFSGASAGAGQLNLSGRLDVDDFGRTITLRVTVEPKVSATLFQLSYLVEGGSGFEDAAMRSATGYVGTAETEIGQISNGTLTGLTGTAFGLLADQLSGLDQVSSWSAGSIRYEIVGAVMASLH